MHETSGQGPRSEALRRRPILLALLIGAAVGLGTTWVVWHSAGDRPEVLIPDPNALPGVRYVGDAACARCHADIVATYSQHPMGRSLTPIDSAPDEIRGGEVARVLFEAQGCQYSVVRRGGATFHQETRRDGQGRVIGQVEGEVRFVLGSGSRAKSFLIDRDGYLLESPITWYAQQRRWDLSPGFEDKTARFERQIVPECLFCHANQIEHVKGTTNRYRPPTFRGHSIGCERCHGPGELHARQPVASPDAVPNIVNPRDLEPALREAVCQQCHLLGEKSIERAGRGRFDYRPGLPLHRFVTVFVRPPGPARDHQNASHVEQMNRSQCFRASRGALGCISCHDPHRRPAPEEKVAYFRDRCLECHADRACSLPPSSRREQSPEDSCIECHMPSAATSNIPHVATTIHSIPRSRDGADTSASSRHSPAPAETLLVPFHADLMSLNELRETSRDRGIALCLKGEKGAAEALPLLVEALRAHPDDFPARESEGFALGALGRAAEGLASFEMVLSRAPGRESSLWPAATLAADIGDRERSIAYRRRAIASYPWRSDDHFQLANLLAQGGEWPDAAEECRRALRINPSHLMARKGLIECSLHMGLAQEAREEFDTLLEFAPQDREALMRWFNSVR